MIAQYSTVVWRREEKLSYFKVDNHFPLFLRCLNQLCELGNHYSLHYQLRSDSVAARRIYYPRKFIKLP